MNRRRVWITVIILAAVWAYFRFPSSPLPVTEALKTDYVRVELTADNGTRCTVRVDLRPNGPKTLSISIPAGTFIRNSDPGSQLLMTANRTVIHLNQSDPPVSTEIETYCVNQFAAEPTRTSSLAFVPQEATSVATAPTVGAFSASGSYQPGGESITVETEPLRKLAECLEKSGESLKVRQLAVWLVSGHYLGMPYSKVREQLRKQYSKIMAAQVGPKLEATRAELASTGLTQEQISTALRGYGESKLQRDLDAEAGKQAQKDLDAFVTDGKRALESCDSSSGDQYFFRTASSRS